MLLSNAALTSVFILKVESVTRIVYTLIFDILVCLKTMKIVRWLCSKSPNNVLVKQIFLSMLWLCMQVLQFAMQFYCVHELDMSIYISSSSKGIYRQ